MKNKLVVPVFGPPDNPGELAASYSDLRAKLPWLNVFGGCCGSDLRHVTAIAHAVNINE